MITVTVSKILRDAGTGEIRVQFGKRERVFENIQQMRAFVRDTLDRDALEAIALALMLERQPALGNPSVFESKQMVVDLTAANWGRIV